MREVSPRGKSTYTLSPSRATRSMCGPPGNGSPSSRATLSNASPAASSIVAPIGSTPGGHVLDPEQAGVAAADQHRQARLGQRPVLELVDRDVRGEVVDAVDRLAEPDRERLGGGDADHQRAGQARAAGDRDRVDVVQPDAGGLAGPLDRRHHRLEVRAAGDLRARRRRTGRARRRCSRPRRRAGCGRGRSRRRSRRRRSRCRGPGVRAHGAHSAAPPQEGPRPQPHHDRGRAVAVVAAAPVDLDEPARGVERDRAARCPRGPRAAAGRRRPPRAAATTASRSSVARPVRRCAGSTAIRWSSAMSATMLATACPTTPSPSTSATR